MNQQIVNLRAIAILLVMLGHSIIIYDNSFELLKTNIQMPVFEQIKHVVSFVQMKLFISISGFLLMYKCLNNKKQQNYIKFCKDKIVRLIFPYFLVGIIYNDPLKYLLSIPGYESPLTFLSQQLLGINCAHLWYLPCLFFLMLICYPIFIWASKSAIKHIFCFIVFLGVNYFSGYLPEYFQIKQVGYYLIFFHLGYLINFVKYMNFSIYNKMKVVYIQILLLVIVVIFGYYINKITSVGFELYLSVFSILLFYRLMPSFKNRLIDNISIRSYGLYLFHSPLIYLTAINCPDINPWLMLFINFICFGGVAYFITISLSRSRFKFIIGE